MAIKNEGDNLFGLKPYKIKKGEEYMNKEQVEHFREILQAWKKQLQEERSRTVTHIQNDAVNYADPIDLASQQEAFSLDLKQSDRARKLIRRIDDALERLGASEYGYCVDCGADIGVRRLEARPIALKCIDCKTFDEIREKQTGGS
ncbi:MAG: RNA polymerase-binding protein DksA [Gammaproteobacteria bacterium]|nr:RNA polymerase-binding protein DksA [Gammaproteobacteria bacterium]